jgi:hypothetical protein
LRTGRGRGSTRASESSSSSSRAFCSAIVLIRPPMVRCLGGSRGRTVRAERAHGHSGQRPRPGARRAAPRAAAGGTRPWRPASGCPTLAAELPRRRCAAGHPASMVGCLNAVRPCRPHRLSADPRAAGRDQEEAGALPPDLALDRVACPFGLPAPRARGLERAAMAWGSPGAGKRSTLRSTRRPVRNLSVTISPPCWRTWWAQ